VGVHGRIKTKRGGGSKVKISLRLEYKGGEIKAFNEILWMIITKLKPKKDVDVKIEPLAEHWKITAKIEGEIENG